MIDTSALNVEAASEAINNINWLQPSWDLFIVLFFVVASLIYGVSLGRDRIIVILVAIYMSLSIVNYVPYVSEFSASISVNDAFALRVSVFIGIFILLFFFLSHSALLKTLGNGAVQGALWQVMLFSFLQVGLLISVTLSFFPQDLANVLSAPTRAIFVSDQATTFWILAPVIVMAIMGSFGDDEYRRRRY